HLALTAHAATRMAQRAIATDDVELIGLIGTEVEGGYFVRTKDFQVLDRELKRLRDRARRLVGKRLVVEDGLIVTGYHARRGKERRLLRGAEERSLAARDPRIRF
ncbi:MAG: hypothetical protein ABI906_02720, partial [Pseudomonadota bacterium]